jgi:hypothetical protein
MICGHAPTFDLVLISIAGLYVDYLWFVAHRGHNRVIFSLLLLPLEHTASVKRFAPLQFLNLVDSQ